MKEWIKDHALEMVAIVISLGGAKGLFDFWARLHEMFGTYLAEASFACALSAAVAAVVTAFFMRCSERRKLAAKDAEIADLRERPEQSAEEQKVKSILSSLDKDKLGLVGMVLARGSIDEHAEKGNRAFLVESGILARVEPSAIEAFASYTLTSIASAVIAGDEALKESAMKQGRELAGRIEERSERAREELNAQRRLTEIAARVPELERRAETAEAKLKEYESEFDLRRFSPEQKRAMLKCWAIEQRGEEGGVMAEWDNPVCDALVDAGVLRCSADRVQGWNYQFNFEPKWRRYLAEHIGDLESEAGPIE